jgi:hypothetical protein
LKGCSWEGDIDREASDMYNLKALSLALLALHKCGVMALLRDVAFIEEILKNTSGKICVFL